MAILLCLLPHFLSVNDLQSDKHRWTEEHFRQTKYRKHPRIKAGRSNINFLTYCSGGRNASGPGSTQSREKNLQINDK